VPKSLVLQRIGAVFRFLMEQPRVMGAASNAKVRAARTAQSPKVQSAISH
jgi:hypothetical protein